MRFRKGVIGDIKKGGLIPPFIKYLVYFYFAL